MFFSIFCLKILFSPDYQILKNICDSILAEPKLLNLLRLNQLEALYGCQMYADELNHPTKLLMAFFNELYDKDIVEEKTYQIWVDEDEEICSGKKKALFSVSAWLKVVIQWGGNKELIK